MFGNDNNQQVQDDTVAQTIAPDPTTDATIASDITTSDPPFDTPTGAPEVSAEADLTTPELPQNASEPTATPPEASGNDDLLGIKQQALQQLSPLVGQLDQAPDEKFRTTMMMIQASDDQSLVKTAFEAAKQITDDKARAQALLDIINEINYFTQHTEKPSS